MKDAYMNTPVWKIYIHNFYPYLQMSLGKSWDDRQLLNVGSLDRLYKYSKHQKVVKHFSN